MKILLPRTLPPAFLLLALPLFAQTAQPPAPTASSILNPSISTIQQALDGIRLEKWKAPNSVRDETESNISSIRRDLESTLPPQLTAADQAPDSVAQTLPVFRNIEALYDVLLRVSTAAHLAAPAPQSTALEQATSGLEAARRAFGDQIQSSAAAQDSRIHDLQASLRAVPPPPAPPAPCPPPPAPAPTKKHKPKPATTTPPATPPPAAQ